MKKLLLLITLVSLPSYSAVSANVAFSSDYIWRGMTQSDGPAMSGGFDYASDGGFYAGIWGSNVNFNDGAGSELDYYFGYSGEMGALGFDISYVAFDYPKNETGLDFEEIVLGLSMGDLGVTFALGQDGAPDYTEIAYGLEILESHMVNMMITETILQYHTVLIAVVTVVWLVTTTFLTMVMAAMRMH